MAVSSNLGQSGNTVHSNLYGPKDGMILRHQHSLKCQPISWTSTQFSMITGLPDIIDPGCNKASDLNMAPGRPEGLAWSQVLLIDLSLHLFNTMVKGSSAGHPNHHVPRAQASVLPLVVTWTIIMDAGYISTKDAGMVLGSSLSQILPWL